ncbi:nitric-oxide reductase large subunit [uncultured Brevundimonas sp.]|uniref:nitric-oxide reductase large subunit n=1 Tax=uncultured Brevundimonas sp. TaxID=213418 RepID=UPI0030EEA8D6|tara:strand:- start:124853 stop:127129 length:2277 start_codon:yes stop_codon:yes gene_type:complete
MAHYSAQFPVRRLWLIFAGTMILMFGTLIYFGHQIYQLKPPIPAAVVSTSGETVYSRAEIERGQNVWQSMGGMQQGSIWGHGSYVAPDWSADWLHREALALLDILARDEGRDAYATLAAPQQARLQALLRQEMRTNTYDPQTGVVTVSEARSEAITAVGTHFSDLFEAGSPQGQALRVQYAMPVHATLSAEEARTVDAFFFWTAWAATTQRPGQEITYTSNWPHEPLVGNTPGGEIFMWTFISIFVLLAGIGALVWYYAREFDIWRRDGEPETGFATTDFMAGVVITPSMRATLKYFVVVVALFVTQIGLGIVTAHYAVEGQGLYGLPLADYFPYALTRTWHTQLSVLWIATAWLATGLYVAPLLGGRDPKWQVAGVNFLWVSLLAIVVGSFAGEWLAINRMIPDLKINFWFGHQGYEYLDLGRFWQAWLFIGLLLWVALVLRGMWPSFREKQSRSLLYLVVLATVSIGLLFGAGLVYGQHTHISIMEYWRWWVVHLWVEGVFEVFATAIVAALFVRMGLVRVSVATTSVLFATLIFLAGGVLGTFHHLYFSGTPVAVIALGSVFSALEVVPLMVVGFEAYSRAQHSAVADWQKVYHWPFMFFAAVLVWNLIGAGLFGFLINPPLALYYMQGLNTTATHAHAALFGVYGMLGLGLMLFCLRGLTDPTRWNNRLLAISFWCLNIGLAMMVFLSLLPQGLLQAHASFTRDYAFARSAEFIHSPLMETLVWVRVPGDIVFSVGVFAFAVFLVQAVMGARKR